MRYFAFVEYNGNNYNGFQKQKQIQKNSIQEEIEKAFKRLFKSEIQIYIGSRTDSGVHAYKNCFHFNITFKINEERVKRGLNKVLPKDISILEIKQVLANANSRFSAKTRRYNYIITKQKSVFNIGFDYEKFDLLNIRKMNEAANILIGEKSFKTFSKINKNEIHDYKCIIYESSFKKDNDKIIFDIKGNRFTHNMIRCLVYNIIQIGINKTTIDDFIIIMNKKNNTLRNGLCPACGLVLVDVEYDNEIFLGNKC